MMQCVLSHKTWRWVVATHRLLAGASLANPPGVLCLFAPHLPRLAGRRLLSTSASGHAAQYPKQQKLHPPPGKEPRPSPAPCDHAGDDGARRMETDQPGFASEVDPLQDRSIGLFQRFKKTFKQYGKVMIPVHLATSSVWFGMFYYAAMKGVNVVPFLELMGLPESLVGLLRDSSSGYALTAYAMYKIATPARYTATLGGTSLSVQYLRKHGYFSTPPPVKDYIQDKMEETKEKLTEKMEETKEKLTEKMEETKERLSEKMEETKDKFSEKLQETKDKVSEGKAFFRKKAD